MIILLGFPKSGTSSFQILFEKLGLKSIHWKYGDKYVGTTINENKKKNLPLLSGFENIDAITQMDICISTEHCYWPQLVDFKKIYFENKDAIFILNKRNPKKILNSFKKWNNYYERIHKYNPELIKDKTENGFITYIKNYYIEVETFFKDIPYAKFISFDIENDELSKLSKYIDLKDIKSFPHENKNKK